MHLRLRTPGTPDAARLRAAAALRTLFEDDTDEEHVEHFRYKQDLQRKLSVVSIIGLGFTLMGVPFGLSLTLWISLVDGGSVTMLYGWLVVGFFSTCVVLSLCEIISKYPTAGGVYHFSAILSNERYSMLSSWFTGWFLLIGNWTYAVLVMFSGAQFVLSVLGLKDLAYKQDTMMVLGVYFCILTFVGVVNFRFYRYLEHINKLCIVWSLSSVLVIDVLLIVFAKRTNSISQIFTQFDNSRSGWPDPIAFMVGLQALSFTLTGYGMLFSMTDEVRNPEKNMPKGAISAIGMSVLQGLIFILPILVILPELTVLLDQTPEIMPIDIVFKAATESYIVSFLLALLLIGTVLFQAIGALTTSSRCAYAFARDGGLPFKDVWVEVGLVEEYALPKNALFLSMGVCAVFLLLALVSLLAFSAFLGSLVISLALANGIPIMCLMMNKRRKVRGGAFRLRHFGWLVNGLAVFWVAFSVVILCFPPVAKHLTWRSMNYALVVVALLALLAIVGFRTWGLEVFTGPLIDTDYEMVKPEAVLDREEQINHTGTSMNEHPITVLNEPASQPSAPNPQLFSKPTEYPGHTSGLGISMGPEATHSESDESDVDTNSSALFDYETSFDTETFRTQ